MTEQTVNPTPGTPISPAGGIDPTGPEPWRPWDDYRQSYNFRAMPGLTALFIRFLIEECRARDGKAVVLDIGAGEGIGRKVERARQARAEMGELWGVEPDTSVTPHEGIFDNYQHALMETADLPENYFDIAFSYMVMEHVEDPEAFMKAVERVLKPGGVYLFCTPNGQHYFTIIGGALKAIRLDELILRLLRGKQVDEYHYPVQYKFNQPRQIEPIGDALGFEKPEYVHAECTGPHGYFPGPLKAIFWMFMKKRELIKKPELLLELYVKMTKKP